MNVSYILYNGDGRIFAWGNCPADQVAAQFDTAHPGGWLITDGTVTGATHRVQDGQVVPLPPPSAAEIAAAAADALARARAAMRCTRLQGMLALGEARWAQVLAYRDAPGTTWAERAVIDDAADWARLSQGVAFFAWLLGLGDTEVDDLFRAAVEVTA